MAQRAESKVVETGGSQTDSEGCLSFPGINIRVTRPTRARVAAVA